MENNFVHNFNCKYEHLGTILTKNIRKNTKYPLEFGIYVSQISETDTKSCFEFFEY